MVLQNFEQMVDISPVTIITASLVLFLGILYWIFKDRGLPPGPSGLPYLGYWPFLKEKIMHLQLQDLMKKYGEVYSLKISGNLFIHLGSSKAIKEAHITKADCFTQRYTEFSVFKCMFDEGLACSNGEAWKTLRKFFAQAFRELGLTSVKDYMAGPIYDFTTSTIQNLQEMDGSPFNLISVLTIRSSAIMRRILFSDDGIYEKEICDLIEAYGKVLEMLIPEKMLLIGEFARNVIFPLTKGYKNAVRNQKKIVDILKRVIKRHEDTFDEDNIRDIIDKYIKERNERRRKGDPTAQYFTENALISTLIQVVGDGTLGIDIFTGYFILALLEHPEEQDKIYKELEDVIGSDRQPTIEDKLKLPYTNAFIQEVLRMTEFFPFIPSLECTKETMLYGYRIPKGAITLLNFWAVHHDPNVYEDPDEFRPSRYIVEPGKQKPEVPILFGVGKRTCAGEAFTMMQVFLLLTTIVKNFRLCRMEGDEKKSFFDGNMQVCAHARK